MLEKSLRIVTESVSCKELHESVRQGIPSAVFGIPDSFKNYLASTFDAPVLYVVKDGVTARHAVEEISQFSGKKAVYLPPKDETLLTVKAFSKDNRTIDELVDKVCTKRYTKTRIQRILLANLLSITLPLIKDCLDAPLYAKVLAVKKESKDLIPCVCQNSAIPVLTRKSDLSALKKTALKSFEKDALATDLYSLMTKQKLNEHHMLIV